MKSILDSSFKYTPAKEQGPDYLRKKFDKMLRAIREEQKKQAEAKVQQFPKQVRKV